MPLVACKCILITLRTATSEWSNYVVPGVFPSHPNTISFCAHSMALASRNENQLHLKLKAERELQLSNAQSTSPSQWMAGDVVRLHSLQKQSEWNGLFGHLIDTHPDNLHRLHVCVYLTCLRRHSVRIPLSNLNYVGEEPYVDVVWIHATAFNKRSSNSLFTIVRNVRNQCLSSSASSHSAITSPQNISPFVQARVKISQLLNSIDQMGYVRHRTPVCAALDDDIVCFAAPVQSSTCHITFNPSTSSSTSNSPPNCHYVSTTSSSVPRLSMRLRLSSNLLSHHTSNLNVAATALTDSIKTGQAPHQIMGSVVLVRCRSRSESDQFFARNLHMEQVLTTLSFIHTLRTARVARPDGRLPRTLCATLPAAYRAFVAEAAEEDELLHPHRSSRLLKPSPRLPLRRPLPRRGRVSPLVSAASFLPQTDTASSEAVVPTHVC